MDERSMSMPAEATATPSGANAGAATPTDGSLADPRALQILSTEHWSLLSARSLVYNETFARGGMFLSFLSATLVALGLIATATGFSDAFLVLASVILAIDLFVGYASLGRIASATSEDIRFLQAMNRVRHAYAEMVPGVERYFLTGHHDDLATVLGTYGSPQPAGFSAVIHGFTTMPGMIGVITSVVAGALGAVVTMLVTHEPATAALIGVVAFFGVWMGLVITTQRMISRLAASAAAVFPAPHGTPGGRR